MARSIKNDLIRRIEYYDYRIEHPIGDDKFSDQLVCLGIKNELSKILEGII